MKVQELHSSFEAYILF